MPARSTFPSPIPADEVRRLFVEFYRGKPAPGAGGHAVVPSSPVVPHDDPTLLFANAGMNQFKPIFLGQAAPGSALAGLKRAVNSQKCIRAGGKHNDLEDVGRDTYHHTFFEMLGTWSFGDYYKKESIAWGMELLTGVYGIPAERLYATYFRGEPEAGLEPDLEARDLWLGHLPASNVLPGGFKDNFWEMGETGPCGPCSEIHFDRVGARNAARLVNAGDPNVLEVWNHVFIGFNREEGGGLRALPARHIDTGMGLERLVSVLQGKPSNYDTDLFTPLFMAIERITGARPYMGRLGAQDKDNIDTAYRVIADHARALTFALTDGAVPSNEGRGYVLRRILRRAVRYGRQTLGAKPGFFAQLVPVVVERMGGFFPELKQNPQRVMDVVREEEESFGRTLERGLRLFEEAVGGGGGGQVPGEVAFKLHDTYGFPVDLTQLMAEERGMRVDLGGYERLMAEAKEKARAGSAGRFAAGVGPGGGGPLVLGPEAIAQLQRLGVARTDDVDKYHGREVRATVRAIYNGENFDEHVRAGNQTRAVGIVLDRTNFYAESGGQEADHGRMHVTRETRMGSDTGRGGDFRVEQAQAFGGYVLHTGHATRGELRVGDDVVLTLDDGRRAAIRANHTATHLLNLALRDVLGEGLDQKGSLVAPDRLRFDFAHGRPVGPDELEGVERGVRARVEEDLRVFSDYAPLYLAKNIVGVRAIFGEQYPDPVRVVSVGVPVRDLLDDTRREEWRAYSVEFCGGTHVERTGQIQSFVVASEEGIAKGVRRIVALTGVPALAAERAAQNLAQRLEGACGLDGAELARELAEIASELDQLTLPAVRRAALRKRHAELQERVRAAQKAVSARREQEAAHLARQIGESCRASLAEIIVNSLELGSERGALQAAVETVRQMCPRSAVMLFSPDADAGKVTVMASVPPALNKRGLNAGEWVRAAAEAMGGKGGGKPDAAQGGGTDLGRMREAMRAAEQAAARALMS